MQSIVKCPTNSYPRLMEDDGMIVLFNGENSGVVIGYMDDTRESDFSIGHYSNNWNGLFVPFDGEVILKNQGDKQ